MTVPTAFRNHFTALEIGRRAKRAQRFCIGCGTGIDSQGGKRRCGPCSAERLEETIAAGRLKRARKEIA